MTINQRPSHVRLSRFRQSALASAASMALLAPLLLTGQTASAQSAQSPGVPAATTPAAQEETVVVRGVRASIQSSSALKRDLDVVADTLSSDDIGDLPALTIGEAIETITGATTHREKGGASEIAVRGLGPYLSSTTFNGREASNGSGDRSVNFNMFPSEMVNTIAIYKSQRADFVEGGVAGIINLQTLRPLSFNRRRVQLEVRGIFQDYDTKLDVQSGAGYRGTASYVDQFDLGGFGELGIFAGVQGGESNNPEELYNASTTWQACNNNLVVAATANCVAVTPQNVASGATPAGTPLYLVSGSQGFAQITESDDRRAYIGGVQWRLNDTFEVNIDYQQSTYEFQEDRQVLNFSETLRGLTNRVVSPEGILLAYDGNSTIESSPFRRNQIEEYDGGGINLALRPFPKLEIEADYGYSNTYRSRVDREVRMRSNATDINGVAIPGVLSGQRLPYTYDARTGYLPSITVGANFDLNRNANFSAAARTRRTEQIRWDEIKATRLDATYDFDAMGLTTLQAGVRYSEHAFRDVPQDRKEVNFGTSTADVALIASANRNCSIAFPQTQFFADADGGNIRSWASFDPLCLMRTLLSTDDQGRSTDTRNSANRDILETASSAYVMANFEAEALGKEVSGNIGVRFVRTEVDSIGLGNAFTLVTNPDQTIRLVADPTSFTSTAFNYSNDQWLPSLNLAMQWSDALQLRFGLFRAMSRPDPEDLGAGRTFSLESGVAFANVDAAIRSITASGNPATEPLMSWNLDLSAEYYANRDSMVAVAVYYKQFQGGFETVLRDETFIVNGQPVSAAVAVEQTADETNTITGIELTATHRFSYLPAPLDGLGFKASYNYADSDFETEDLRLGDQTDVVTGVTTPGIIDPVGIFGLSEHTFSGSVYYEIGPFDFQAIYKYRSDYYQQFVGAPAQNRLVRAAGVVDFRASWEATDQLSISLEGSNLNNEPRVDDMPIPGSVRQVNLYGQRWFLGARLRL
jgi:iron complex outermembrane recepter protein